MGHVWAILALAGGPPSCAMVSKRRSYAVASGRRPTIAWNCEQRLKHSIRSRRPATSNSTQTAPICGTASHKDVYLAAQWMAHCIQKPVKNQDLWKALLAAQKRHDIAGGVHWNWTKAHAGHLYNERVDRLARDAAMQVTDNDPLDTARASDH